MKRDALLIRSTRQSSPWPLGPVTQGTGTHFSVYAPDATAVDVCLFDQLGHQELQRHALPHRYHGGWHGYLDGVGPGRPYGLRAHGPWNPAAGLSHNAHELLLDPAAREVWAREDPLNLRRDHDGHGGTDRRDGAAAAWLAVTTAGPP